MMGFTRQEQRFILLLIAAFVVGLAIQFYRTHFLVEEDSWQVQREKLWAEFSANAQAEPDFSKLTQTELAEQKKKLTGQINLNTATAEDLELLPKVGPAIAKRIIDYRNQNGPFHSVMDIQKVKGVGPKTYEKLSDYITVDE